MAKHDFPLKELKSDIEDIKASLTKAEITFSKDKGLTEAVKDAKDSAEKVSESLKNICQNS